MTDTHLSKSDRRLLDTWTEHGIPDDQPTRDYALGHMLPRLWADYQRIDRLNDALMEEAP